MLLYAGISLLCFFTALTIWRWARHGKRIDRHPICRKCGYDMFGRDLDELPDCPECGTQIYSRRQLRLGNRRPRKALTIVTLALMLIALIGSIGFTTQWARAYDWNRVKPVSMLIREASDMRNPNRADTALTELTRRDTEDLLSDAGRARLITAALDYQADKAKPWDTRWGEVVSRARTNGVCGPAEWDRYLMQAADFELQFRERINKGDPFVVSGEFITPFRGDDSIRGIDYFTEDALHVVRRLIDGEATNPPLIQFNELYGFGSRYFTEPFSQGFDKLEPGEYEITVSATLRGHEPERSGDLFPDHDYYEVKTVELSARFEVFPENQKLINAIHDPKLAQQAESYIRSSLNYVLNRQASIEYSNYTGKFFVEYGIPSPDIPYPCSFDVQCYIDGQQADFVETVVLYPVTTGNHSYFMTNFRILESIQEGHDQSNPPTVSKFTLRLVPNPEHLKTELDGYDYLDHVIEIKDIPIEPYRP